MSKPQENAGLSSFEDLGAEPIERGEQEQSDSPFLDMAAEATAKHEKFVPTRYRVKGEPKDTIGYGHFIEDDREYEDFAKSLGIKNPWKLNETDGLKLFEHDFKIRRDEIAKKYPSASPALLDIMANKKFQYSPAGFDKRFGEGIRNNDTEALVESLNKEAQEKKAAGYGGFVPRNNEVISHLREYGKTIQSKLAENGYEVGEIDGVIGPKTKEAVKKYQADSGLKPDGVIGPKTFGNLLSALNPFHISEANADEIGIDSFSDLGAEPVDTQGGSSDFSDLGAEPIEEQATPEQIKAIKTPIFERIGKGFGTGVAGMVEGVGGVAKWFGHEKLGESINKYADEMMQYYDVPDPDFTSKVSAGAGSMATFMIPGLGIARGVNALSAMPRLATWLGVSASSVMEASVEAGGAYNKMIAKGMDHKEASTAATKDFWLNLPVLVYTNKFGIFGEGGGMILKGLKSASGEAVQEFSQQLIGNFSTKDPLMEGALESAAVGAIVGGGTGMLMSAAERKEVEKIKAKDNEAVIEEAPEKGEPTANIEDVSTDVAKPSETISVNVTPEMKAAVESGQPTVEVAVPTEVKVESKQDVVEDVDVPQEVKPTVEQPSQEPVKTEVSNANQDTKGVEADKSVAEEVKPIRPEDFKTAEEYVKASEDSIEYHGTSPENAQKILSEGRFKVGSGQKGVSTTQGYAEALDYAGGNPEGVIAVRVRKGSEMKGTPGKDFLTGTGSFSPEDLTVIGKAKSPEQMKSEWQAAQGKKQEPAPAKPEVKEQKAEVPVEQPKSGVIWSDDKREIYVNDESFIIKTKKGSKFELPIQNVTIKDSPSSATMSLLKKNNSKADDFYFIPYGSSEIVVPIETKKAVEDAVSFNKNLANEKKAERDRLYSLPENVERRKIDELFYEADKIERSNRDDNVSTPMMLREKANRLLAEWNIKYPDAKNREESNRLKNKAKEKRRLANGALLYDADGSISREEQKTRHDNLIKEAENLENKADALIAKTSQPRPAEAVGKGLFGASVGSFTEEIAQASAKEQVEIKPVAVIEMVKLARLIMGEFPTLKRFPKARGMFYGQGNGSIKLTPDLFKAGQEKQLAATLAHEIGHLVDYLPDSTLKRGNVLGRLSSLMNYLKTTLPKLSGQDATQGIITPKERARISREVEGKIGNRPKDESALKIWKENRSKAYAEAISKEADRRGLVTHKDIRDEMISLSFEWRPMDGGENDPSYLSYRSSSKELYADFVSALLNSPGYVKTKAPKTYELFFEYLDKKPDFKKQYLFMQQVMQGKPSDLAEIRMEDRRMMFAKGDSIREQLEKEAEERTRDTWQNLRQLLDDRFFPIAKRLNRQKRDAIVPSSEAVHLLREAGMWQVDAYKYTQQIDNEAIKPMIKTGATTQDLGDYQYLRRVIGKAEIDKNADIAKAINSANEEVINALRAQGYEIADNLKDREQLANPLGYTPQSAREALDHLRTRLTSEQWDAIVEADKKYRDITFKIVQQAADEGVYNKKVFEEVILPNKDTYASFGVLDYITDNVAAGIKSSKGTLKEIENPFITTTLKTTSLIRLIARNRATKATIEELGRLYPGDVTESKRMYNAAGPTGYMKAPQGKGQVKYLVDGKVVSYDVDPYISKSMENDDTQMLEVAAAFNKWSGNQIFRNLVITFNPAFQMFNVARDFGRSYVNLNAILSAQGKSVSIRDVLTAYYKAIPQSIKRNMGITDAQLEEMLAHKALGVPFNDYNIDPRDDGFARILRKYKVIGDNMEAKTVREKLVKGWTQVDSAVRFVGNVLETLPKVAGYNLLKEKGVSDRELGYLTRTYLGTPDTQTSGKWTKLTNQIFTFSNVSLQGAKSDVRLAVNPTTRAGWHLANFKISVLPMLAMAAAILGLMGKDLEDWFEKVPEFDKTNYIIIPLGMDNDGRARYIRLPHNQTSRISTAILYKMLTAHKNKVDGLGGAIDITASQLPSLAPVLTTLGAWGSFMQGQNPQDMFRGRPILSEQAYKAGGVPALEKMVQFTFNNYGFSQFTTYDDRRNSSFEAAIQATPFVSALTRIVKTTDYGLVEKARAISKEAQKETAERNIKRTELFEKELRGYSSEDINRLLDREGNLRGGSELKEKLKNITNTLYKDEVDKGDYRTTEEAFIRFALKEYNDPWINGVLSAQSKEVKKAVLEQAKDALSINRYETIIGKLKRAGIISVELEKQINKNQM